MMNTKFHFGVSVEDMDPVSRAVYDGLCAGESKKVLSNRHKMPISVVNAISKRFCTGQKAVQITPALQIYDVKKENEEIESTANVETVAEVVDNTEDKPKRSRRRSNLSQDEINTIVDLLKEGNTVDSIAQVSGVAASTIFRIKKKYGLVKERKPSDEKSKDSKEKEVAEEIKDIEKEETVTENNDLIPINIHNSVRVGLVGNRHNIPVNDYIFKDSISKDMMFDYEALENHCRDYIKDIIDFKDGVAQQSLIVYLTGSQCASSSIIKVTNEMKVNLSFRHYCASTDSYHTQVIWDQFECDTVQAKISELLVNSKNSFAYKCTLEELCSSGNLVRMTKVYYNSDDSMTSKEVILTKSIDDAFELMRKFADEENDQKIVTSCKGYKLEKGKFVPTAFNIKMQIK